MDGFVGSPEDRLLAAGVTIHKLRPSTTPELKPAHRLLTPADIADEAPRPYVIKGLISEGDHAVLIGQPGSGKSVLAPHLAYAVAQGREVLGRRVKPGPVLYIAAEDVHGMKGRVRALMRRHGNAPNFYLFPASVNLTNPAEVEEIKGHVEAIQPALIVLDTVARAFPGLRENEAEDMSRVVKMAREMTEICNSAVVSVHHVAKDAGTTPRGHGCLNGDADITILVEGTGRGVRSVKLGKNRSGPSDVTFAFQIEVEELGTDEDGDPITAPVATEADAEAASGTASGTRRLTQTDMGWLRELVDMFAEPDLAVERVPKPGMTPVRALTREQVRAGYRSRGRIGSGPDASLTGAERQKLSSMLNRLKDHGKIAMTADLVWLL